MRSISKYSRDIVKIILDIIRGLIMRGRCIVQRISSRMQTIQLSAASLRKPEELPGAVVKSNITRAETDNGLNSSTELTVTAVAEPGTAELITASEEPIFETVSPVIDDPSVIEEAVVTEEIPLAPQTPVSEEIPMAAEIPAVEESAAVDLAREDEEIAPTPNAAEKIAAEPADTQFEAYCVKCRTRRGMKDAKRIVTKNNRNAIEGTCLVCGTRLFRFIATK